MECISLDVKNNWALKLGNLRRLKKALDKYLEEELKISNSKFDRIDLPNLARKANPDEMIKLFEGIFYAILNCPEKSVFIKRIMDLEEPVQIQLMFFIQKIIGENEENLIQDSDLFKKELEVLKKEKKVLSKQVSDLEKELNQVNEEKKRMETTLVHLKSENENLYADIDKRSYKEEKHSSDVINELRIRLNDKDETLSEMQKSIDKIKIQYENEIAQLKDDLDIATAKVYQNMNADKTLQQYKKRLESLAGVKQKATDLQKQNENLIETINSQHAEIENLQKFKKQVNLLKEQCSKEKNRADTLSFNLDNKEKTLKKYEKEIIEFKQKISLLESKNAELVHRRQDSYRSSDDSFSIPPDKETASNCNQLDIYLQELTSQKTLNHTKKIKRKALKERVLMCIEEMHTKSYELLSQIKQLESNNLILSDQITILSENLAEKENEKVMHEQILYEFQELKASKASLVNEIKSLYIEKDQIHKKYLDGREEYFILQSQINSKDLYLRELELEIRVLQDKVQAFAEKEKIYNQELTSLRRNNSINSSSPSDPMALEREIIALKNEITELQHRLKEKIERINEITASKEELTQKLNRENQEIKEKFDKELEIKTKELMAQSEEAMNELFKERERLAAKLQYERRNTMIGWQRAMSVRDPNLFVNEEVFKLREVLVEREKEIARVSKNNKELKLCWKDSAKLLKAVWKQLGDETKKIEEAVRKRSGNNS